MPASSVISIALSALAVEAEAWVSAGVRKVVPMAELKDVFGPAYEEVGAAVAMNV